MRFEFTQDGEFEDPYYKVISTDDNKLEIYSGDIQYSEEYKGWFCRLYTDYSHSSMALNLISKKVFELNIKTFNENKFYWF